MELLSVLAGAVIGAIVSVGTTYIAQRFQFKTAIQTQIQARRTQRLEYLNNLMKDLMLAAYSVEAIYGRFDGDMALSENKEAKENYASAMGRAAAVCLATGIPELKPIKEKMTPYLVQDHRNINRAALHSALEILAAAISKQAEG